MYSRRARWPAVVFSFGLLATLGAQGSFTAYDNFNGGSIAPRLWRGYETGGAVREALRLVVADPLAAANRRLLLLNLSYGGFESNSGTSTGILALNMADPGSVGGIQATVEAGSFWPGACAASTAVTTTMAGIGGAYFNPDPIARDATGDVWATLGLERGSNATTAANLLTVVARLTRCADATCQQRALIGEQSLGSAARFERVVLRLDWDRTNKRFLFQRGATAAAIPYSADDSLAPVFPAKGLLTSNAVANCESAQPAVALMEAYFDDVSTTPVPALPSVFPPDQYEPNETGLSAYNLGQVGDGATQVYEAGIHSIEDRDWFRIRAVETTGPFCFPGDDQGYRTTFQLTGIPPGRNYDLYVHPQGLGGPVFSSASPEQADETVQVNWLGTCGSPDERDFYIEVRRASGLPSDLKYRLTVSHRRN